MKEAPLYALRRCGPLLAADSSRNQFEALRRVEALGYPISYVEGYWGAVRELLAGRGLYGFAAPNGDPFTYPPFAALLLIPVAWLSEDVAQVLWIGLDVVAVVMLARLAVRAQSDPRGAPRGCGCPWW
jgi:hypothetical protein